MSHLLRRLSTSSWERVPLTRASSRPLRTLSSTYRWYWISSTVQSSGSLFNSSSTSCLAVLINDFLAFRQITSSSLHREGSQMVTTNPGSPSPLQSKTRFLFWNGMKSQGIQIIEPSMSRVLEYCVRFLPDDIRDVLHEDHRLSSEFSKVDRTLCCGKGVGWMQTGAVVASGQRA